MNFKEYLESKGLTEEQVTAIVSGMSDAKIYLSTEENIDERYAKLKLTKEQADADIVSANALVEDLKKGNVDNEELQSKVKEYEKQIEQITAERDNERTEWLAKEALKDAVDPEYALFKLKQNGELEVDDKGQIKDIENRVKALRESSPTMFKEVDEGPKGPGYTVVNNELKDKATPQNFDLSKMTAEEINANWDAIQSQDESK